MEEGVGGVKHAVHVRHRGGIPAPDVLVEGVGVGVKPAGHFTTRRRRLPGAHAGQERRSTLE